MASPPTAGYSGKPLTAKLGLKAGQRLALIGAPRAVATAIDVPGLARRTVLAAADALSPRSFDVIHLFADQAATLRRSLPTARKAIDPAGMIWVSWPKQASGVATDVTEDVVRKLAIAAGLVDVKVCAVDATWSGLKLVVPVKDRPKG
ncbi:MAG: DUF3052 family protein [Proteobacteria bacterium]|nr:DUF3052 family protein [Pseudomonadota bacterium]